jgi:predicted RNase H-like HicB family nuclease
MVVDVVVERIDNGSYKAHCPAIPGSVGYGKTENEAREKLKCTIITNIKDRLDNGLPICTCGHDCV